MGRQNWLFDAPSLYAWLLKRWCYSAQNHPCTTLRFFPLSKRTGIICWGQHKDTFWPFTSDQSIPCEARKFKSSFVGNKCNAVVNTTIKAFSPVVAPVKPTEQYATEPSASTSRRWKSSQNLWAPHRRSAWSFFFFFFGPPCLFLLFFFRNSVTSFTQLFFLSKSFAAAKRFESSWNGHKRLSKVKETECGFDVHSNRIKRLLLCQLAQGSTYTAITYQLVNVACSWSTRVACHGHA